MSDLEAFLGGRRPDHVVIVLADELLAEPEALEEHAEPVENGLALVLPGHRGRSVFQRATGRDPMAFARLASDRESDIARSLSDGDCPEVSNPDAAGIESPDDGRTESGTAGDRRGHYPAVVFAFAERQNEGIGGLYAEGNVIHAYARCACGAHYADRWVVDDG